MDTIKPELNIVPVIDIDDIRCCMCLRRNTKDNKTHECCKCCNRRIIFESALKTSIKPLKRIITK